MSRRLWLIDGHNVIFAVPSLHALQVTDRREEARRTLADRLERFAHARGEKVLIVFDGNDLATHPDAGRGPMIAITYMRPAEGGADTRIIYEAKRRAGMRRPVTVVTDDVSTLAGKLPRAVVHLSVSEFWLKHIEGSPPPGGRLGGVGGDVPDIDGSPPPGGKRVEGDFSDIEGELLEYSAAEEASAARAAETPGGPAEPDGAPRGGHHSTGSSSRSGAGPDRSSAEAGGSSAARRSAEPSPEEQLRLKRERGRRRQKLRLERQRKARRRRR